MTALSQSGSPLALVIRLLIIRPSGASSTKILSAGLPVTWEGLKMIFGLITLRTRSAKPGEALPPPPMPWPIVPPLPLSTPA